MLWDKIQTVEEYISTINMVGIGDTFTRDQLYKFFMNRIESEKYKQQVVSRMVPTMSTFHQTDNYNMMICNALLNGHDIYTRGMQFSRLDYHIFRDTVPPPDYKIRYNGSLIIEPLKELITSMAGRQDEVWRLKNFDLYVLHDELEELGMLPDSIVMKHLREERHYSNCWVLSLLLL